MSALRALRVLHVEDESDIREVVGISLGLDPDLETRSCSSGHEALAVAEQWAPDIILLDVMMPVMDGPTTLARLRDNAKTARIPVIFMTARAQTREIELFRSLGAVGVIPKPFDPMTLAAAVRTYVRPANDRLDALRNVFLQRLNDDAVALVWHRCTLDHGTAAAATRAGIRDLAHGLAGTGGIFGFSEISDAAAALEDAVICERDGSGTAEAIAAALDRLLACAETNGTFRRTPSHSLNS